MNHPLQILHRHGASRRCPECGAVLRFTAFNVSETLTPFFYSTSGRAVLLRRSDARKFAALVEKVGQDEVKLVELAEEILADAPLAPDGTRFDLWANIRCGDCGYEFPYDGGERSIVRKLSDPKVALADGMAVIGDVPAESYIVQVDLRA